MVHIENLQEAMVWYRTDRHCQIVQTNSVLHLLNAHICVWLIEKTVPIK